MNRYIQLIRIGNCVMGVVGLILGTLVAQGTDIVNDSADLIIAAAVVFMFIVGGNSLNDYLDREVDKQAHPERPIPSGRIRPETARNISIASFVLAFALSVLLDWISFLIVASAIGVILAYEFKTKKLGLTGNLSIAWLTGALFLLGGAVVGKVESTVAIGLMAFLATLGREIVKDSPGHGLRL